MAYLYYRGGLNDSGQYIHERSEDGIQWEFYDPEQVINFIDTGTDPDIADISQRAVTHHCPNCEAAARELAELQALCDREAELLTSVARALRGPEPPQTSYGWADLPERAKSAAREIADLKSDKAWADKLSAENADELSNLRHGYESLRSGIERILADYPRDIKQDAEEALRDLLAEPEAKK